jgi:hypothetical protein
MDETPIPLDINVDYTRQNAERNPIEPGGKFTVYGDFCWGGEKNRAEVYFISAGTQPPATIAGTDIEAAKRTQQQLIASGLRGQAVQSSDRDVVFTAPDKDTILSGSGNSTLARLIVYDNKAKRASGVTAAAILTMRAQQKSIPLFLIIGGAFGLVVIVLLLIIALRGGKRRTGGPAPAPVVAGGAPYALRAAPTTPGPMAVGTARLLRRRARSRARPGRSRATVRRARTFASPPHRPRPVDRVPSSCTAARRRRPTA